MKIDKAQYKLFLKFLRYLWPYRRKQISILFLSVLSVLLGLVIPYLSKLVVDKGIINREMRSFIVLGVIGAGVFIINGLIKAISALLERSMRLKVGFDLNKKVFSHLQELPIGFFRNRSTGEHMFRIDYDIERIVDLIVSIPQESIKIFPRLLFILIIIFYLDWRMALFSVVLAPIMYLPVCYFTRRMRRVLEELLANSQNIFKRMEEVFSHIYLVKALGKEKREIKGYLRALIGKIRIRLKNTRLEIISELAGGGFERVIIGLITLFGGYQVIKGKMSAGTLTAIMIYLTQLVALQSSIAFFFQSTVLGLVSCRRLDEILQEKPEPAAARGRKKKVVFNHPRIEFKKVSFGYRQGENVLRTLDFNIIEEGTVALVGASGCGKSTILNLILGLYEPWQGEIFIDGHNIKDLETGALREQIGVALEEPFLWNDTIENNIKYTRESAAIEEVIESARLAGVDEFVKELPQGYRTVIGENACKLSEGQKQKLSIARALVKNPKILILDEAMSSMDSASEEKILSNIKEFRNVAVSIVVSHRLSTVMAADSVYFFSGPDTIETGSVAHLLKNNREFCNLFSGQGLPELVCSRQTELTGSN